MALLLMDNILELMHHQQSLSPLQSNEIQLLLSIDRLQTNRLKQKQLLIL
jgi:hypothetical protein